MALSIWCDFIEREFLEGEFRTLVDSGLVRGATTNPSIFASALKGKAYRSQLEKLAKSPAIQSLKARPKAKALYEELALEDIAKAALILSPLYENNPKEGLISLELDPKLCRDAEASIEEGLRLWNRLEASNVMIKVPATKESPAIMQALIARGVNLNANLVFSLSQALAVLEGLEAGYAALCGGGGLADGRQPQAVISVFVSRFDRALDSKLSEGSRGKYGIANAASIYEGFKAVNKNPNIRILFASTGLKQQDSLYNDPGYYVYPLAFEDCINTLPLPTLKSLDTSRLRPVSPDCLGLSSLRLELEASGLDYKDIEARLLGEGLASFESSFEELLDSMEG